MKLQIRKLNKDTINDFLYFFDNVAFCDNPDWSSCYCYFFYVSDNDVWLQRNKDQNRKDAIDAIMNNQMNGFIAYLNNSPVGWCNADIISNYDRILDNEFIEICENVKVGSIVCFIVDHNHRRKGIASTLLKSVCNNFEKEDFDIIEAYPRKNPKNAAENYYGPLSMYLNNGFSIYKELEDFYIVQKKL